MVADISYFGDRLDFIPTKGNEACVFYDDQYSNSLSFLVDKMATATCGICYATNHSTNMCSKYQDYLNAYLNKFRVFHSNLERGMTLLQMGMIKVGGTTPTLIMHQSQLIFNINNNSNSHHRCQNCSHRLISTLKKMRVQLS